MGGNAKDLKRAFEDNDHQQIPIPPTDPAIVAEMKRSEGFVKYLRSQENYNNYLKFFETEVETHGCKGVLCQYLFASTPVAKAMFVQLYEGLYHPLIHIGFGIEFDQPAIVAEGLAQAASHTSGNISNYFARCDELAQSEGVRSTPLRELYRNVRASDKIRTAVQLQQGPNRIRDGLMPNAMEELAVIAAQFRVGRDNLDWERGLIESTSCAAYNAAAAQRESKATKLDFFSMHAVTSSIFLSLLVRQSWIANENKAKLIEWKGRLDLAWYASSRAPQLDLHFITSYQPTISKDMNWHTLYEAIVNSHDDGHVAKFVRALYNAETEMRDFVSRVGRESITSFPIQGDLWFRAAQMCLDSTTDMPLDEKWLMGSGFDTVWDRVPEAL
ncbi:hypothetical protein CMQ_1944 [Grosmannia clavigera kw1407]|uniref:HypA-like protein n=1 Tax=Grosmannia clavigera (strain kw1407 / UAMH 11150) TaxID=655863 RepID=F0XMV7_GROCL|nr:uncharacterized protein CMQ_1944 [Grosmannia clavigera kw1407]EFX00863.1 hypothetical protein CMQ_1944 [Grosmannia clavigera kw1407]